MMGRTKRSFWFTFWIAFFVSAFALYRLMAGYEWAWVNIGVATGNIIASVLNFYAWKKWVDAAAVWNETYRSMGGVR